MPGIKALRKVQLGLESTPGTGVPATVMWRGTGTMLDQLVLSNVQEDVGVLGMTANTYIGQTGGEIVLGADASFEQVPYALSAGVEGIVTGVADGGGGSGKIYQFDVSTTAQNTTKTYTIEAGDNQQEEEAAYGIVTNIRYSGASGAAVTEQSTWQTHAPAPSTYASLSLTAAETILFQKGKLYIDATGGTIGTTQKSNTLLGFDLDLVTGLRAVWTADGSLNFSFTKIERPAMSLTVTFEHDGTATTEKAFWRAQTTRLLQLKFEGSALATPGTAYTYKTMLINMCGRWRSFEAINEQNGNDIVRGVFDAMYVSTNTPTFGQIIVVNELASLT